MGEEHEAQDTLVLNTNRVRRLVDRLASSRHYGKPFVLKSVMRKRHETLFLLAPYRENIVVFYRILTPGDRSL